VVLEWAVTHVASSNDWSELPAEIKAFMYFSCADGAFKYTMKKLESLGFNGDFGTLGFSNEAHTDGVEVVAKTEIGHDNKPRQSWELVNWGGGGERADDSIVAGLNARYKAASAPAAAIPGGRPSSTPPQGGQDASKARDEAKAEAVGGIYCDEAKDGKPDMARWNQLIAKVSTETSRPMAMFTPDDWKKVTAESQIPF